MKKITPFLILTMLIIAFSSCESEKVKQNRKTYKDFLIGMSDAPEFLEIKSEKVNDDTPSKMYFIVDFKTKYCGKKLEDNVKIEFLGDLLYKIDGVYPTAYKGYFLLDILK